MVTLFHLQDKSKLISRRSGDCDCFDLYVTDEYTAYSPCVMPVNDIPEILESTRSYYQVMTRDQEHISQVELLTSRMSMMLERAAK